MSTTAEVIVARHCGLRVLALSLVTNKCVMDHDAVDHANHGEVLTAAQNSSKHVQKLVANIVEQLGNNN